MFGSNWMALLGALWQDDRGAVTLEYLLLGTMVGIGGVAGLSAMSDAVNDEMREYAGTVRQLRQAYKPTLPTARKGMPGVAPRMTVPSVATLAPEETVPYFDGQCDFGCP